MNNKLYIKAKTIDIALIKAAGKLGTLQENIEYKIIKKNFIRNLLNLNFIKNEIEITAWKKKVETKDDFKYKSTDKSINFTLEFLKNILNYVFRQNIEILYKLEDDRLILNINTDDSLFDKLSKKNMKLLYDLEYLLFVILRKKNIYFKKRIFIDINYNRMEYENSLKIKVKDISAKAKNSDKPFVLNLKSYYDKKIVDQEFKSDNNLKLKWTNGNRKLTISKIQ